MSDETILAIDPAEGPDVTAFTVMSVETGDLTSGKMQIHYAGSTTAKEQKRLQNKFRLNFMAAIEYTTEMLDSLIPKLYVDDFIECNYLLGLPDWYVTFVYKYFRWLL